MKSKHMLDNCTATRFIRLRAWKDGLLDIIIHTHNVELTEELRQAVLEKIGRVRQYAPLAFRARVQFHRERLKSPAQCFKVTVQFELPGNDLIAEHRDVAPLAALDLVAEKIERRLRKRKTAELARRFPPRAVRLDTLAEWPTVNV
jgi:ribosomal subunit interface protein